MDTAAPPAENAVSRRSRLRASVYCVALACLAAVLMFHELGADALANDEAQYALVVQNIRQSGDWIYLTPYPPAPYLQKPPLYFWLTAMTYDVLGGPSGSELPYRVWSAASGVGAVVLTCVLGAMLFTPEVGALAGLLLLLNRAFLLVHGARSGTFDTLLTLFAVAAAVLYLVTVRGRFRWTGWIGIGLIAGLASITKPFAGVPIVGLLAIHAIFMDRGSPLRIRLGGPGLAMLVLLIVAAPWYAAQWHTYPHFVDEVFRKNLVQRISQGVDRNVKSWKYYPQELSKSSPEFLLIIPAVLYTLAAWMKGPRRWEHALLALIGVGWVIMFSLSAAKLIHYAYPALPALSVILADAAVRLWDSISRRLNHVARSRDAVITAALMSALFAFQYAWTLYFAIPDRRSPHVPWEMYKTLAPAIRSDGLHVIFCGFPEHQIDWRTQMQLPARDCYYLEQMRVGAAALRDAGQLADVLRAETPVLLILSRHIDVSALVTNSNLTRRADSRFVYRHQGFLMLGVDLEPVLEPVATPGSPNAYIRAEEGPAVGSFRLMLSPQVIGPGRVGVRVRLPEGSATTLVRYVLAIKTPDGSHKTLQDQIARPSNGVLELSAIIGQRFWPGPGPHEVTLKLHAIDPPSSDPVRSTLEESRLIMLPDVPADSGLR